jgi:hypothetical protein
VRASCCHASPPVAEAYTPARQHARATCNVGLKRCKCLATARQAAASIVTPSTSHVRGDQPCPSACTPPIARPPATPAPPCSAPRC